MPAIAVIIPVWHHPALVDEAVLSCLAQEGAADFQIILVNDGCDLRQTRQSLEGWQAAHPQRITLLTQENQGLSAARNAGIEHALKDPALEAIYFLDADNRLDRHAVSLFTKLLEGSDEAGWFYPQFDRIGLEANISNGGYWSLSRLAATNFCDAGSLVRRAVFDTGLRFDPAFNVGFEDWDFWLGAAKYGFVGAPVMQSFLRYRKRPESMISAADRSHAQLRGQLRDKHSWLYNTGRLGDAWGQEWPRFALIGTDGSFLIGSDPSTAQPVSREQMIAEIFGKRANPAESWFPQMLVFYAPEALGDLRAAKLLDSCLYQLEGGLRQSPVVGLKLHKGQLGIQLANKTQDEDGQILAGCDMIAMSMHHLNASLDLEEMADIFGYMLENVPVIEMDVHIPAPSTPKTPPLDALMDLVGGLVLSPEMQVPAAQNRNWREQVFAPVAEVVAAHNAGGRPALAPLGKGPHVGFVIQVFHFGGVEKCLVALARELALSGVTCYLFIYGDDDIAAADWMLEPFAKIWILNDPALKDWRGGRYLGTGGAEHPGDTLLGDALGPLTQMDTVVNCGAGVGFHGLAALRARGVKTATWEHIIESSAYGRSTGSPYISIGYEAGCDRILTCSNQLATKMAAHGVPRSKLLPLPNGPGYQSLSLPARKAPAGNIRVGFLGRFDPQKQVERFIDVAKQLRGQFDFTVVGGAVLGAPVDFPAWLQPTAPIKKPAGLDAFFASIDVLLMPSRDEGLPLTILEAQRAGVVVLASDVGAVSEAIKHGETGFLLSPTQVVADAIETLTQLDTDRATLAKIAKNAAGKPDRWQQNAAVFIESLL